APHPPLRSRLASRPSLSYAAMAGPALATPSAGSRSNARRRHVSRGRGELDPRIWRGSRGLRLLAVLGLAAATRATMASRNATAELERARNAAEISDRRLLQILQAIPVALVQTDPS